MISESEFYIIDLYILEGFKIMVKSTFRFYIKISFFTLLYYKYQVKYILTLNLKKNILITWLTLADINILKNSNKVKLYELVK